MNESRSLQIAKATTALHLSAPGSRVDVLFLPGYRFNLPQSAYVRWLQAAVDAVSAYYGKFPVAHLVIKVYSEGGSDIGFATTGFEEGAGIIEIPVGEEITLETLERDWTATHEMTHLAFPLMDNTHKWLAEGQATYIEPLARLRIGKYSRNRVWGDLIRNLPEGLPERGDRGLNNTHTWGRTYWGGALYCLLADLQIRKQTNNKKGLEDAVTAIATNGGNIASDWEAEEALAAGDKAIGSPILTQLYENMKDQPYPVNLQMLWKQLGIRQVNGNIEFDNSAPLAAARLAIEKGTSK